MVEEQLRQGKTLEDARAGGCTGCVEVGAFGKEAYILTGYFNLPKVLELALHDGVDPRTGRRLGPATGEPGDLTTFDAVFAAFETQMRHVLDVKIAGNQIIERMYARLMPAPFLSVLIDDCIRNGRDYNAGGARYNNTYIQGVGIGTLTDSLAAIRTAVFEDGRLSLAELVAALDGDFDGHEELRLRLVNRTPKYGNDDDRADDLMRRVFEAFFAAVDGRPSARGGTLPHPDAPHHLPRLLRLGHRGHARRPARRPAALRGHLPRAGRGPARGPPPSSSRRRRWTTCGPAARSST